MNFIEITLNVRLKENIRLYELSEKLSQGMNRYFNYNSKTMEFHKDNKFKMYSYSLLEPLEKDKLYKKNKVYNLKIRFMNKEILNDFYNSLSTIENTVFSIVNKSFEAISLDDNIEYLESITPCVITLPYTKPIKQLDRENYDKEFVIKQLTRNACMKYSFFNKTEPFIHEFIEDLDVLNKSSYVYSYKGHVIIGNKFKLKIKKDELSQKIAFTILGSGLAEKNSLSYGFSKCVSGRSN